MKLRMHAARVFVATVATLAASPSFGQLPTTGLFAQLEAVPDADVANLGAYGVFTGAGSAEDPYKMMVWYDKIVDAADEFTLAATSQDYGQDVAARRPSLTQTTMPNGASYWVADLHGGQGDAVLDYDYLQNKPGGAPRVVASTTGEFASNTIVGDGGLYPAGVVNSSQMYNFNATTSLDPAYSADNTGIAWAMVFRYDNVVTTANIYTQVLRTDDTPTKQRAAYLQDTDADGVYNLRAFTRDGAGAGSNHPHDYPNYPDTPTWFIAAGTWNNIDDPLATDNFTTVFLDEHGDLMTQTTTSLDPDGLTNVVLARIGYAPNATNNTGAFFDGQIAELIYWNGGLSVAELNQAVEHLNQKYFQSPNGPMPDLNMDGKVDIFDVAIVSNNWANSGAPGSVTGDANKDGVVDIFDVALISNHWNPGGGAAAVPEPATIGLALMALMALTVGRRR